MAPAEQTDRWSIEQVVAIAPSAARFAAGEALAVASRWSTLGADARVVWGRCLGSGAEPYDTVVDHFDVAWRCSCPSRSQPCKHALALLVLWIRGEVPAAVAPAGVAAWASSRARRADAVAAAVADAPAPSDDVAAPPARDDGEVRPDTDASASTSARDDRIERLRGGLIELDRWLDDRLRTGLADPSVARYATWDGLAARLTDARAGALANRIRRLAGVVGTRPDWHEHVLAEIGVLHLLAQAGQRVPDLPGPLADAVAVAAGWQVRQADVLAGVPDTQSWVVAGRSDTREDRIEVRRVWLRGVESGRWAVVLSFAAYRQRLDADLVVGTAPHADLHRYPGSSLRALLGTVHDGGGAGVAAPPASSIADACAELGAALAVEPWADRLAATVLATPTVVASRWRLTDCTGSLAMAAGAPGTAVLLAASAGEPVAVTVEWTTSGVVPLTVHLPDRALDIGPRADPSFVVAA